MSESYDDLWQKFGDATYDDLEFSNFQYQWFLKRFGLTEQQFHDLIEDKTVLEVGTGAGAFIRNLLPAKVIYGIDSSLSGIVVAEQRYGNLAGVHGKIKLFKRDFYNMPFEYPQVIPSRFDVVIADQVLHHMPDTFQALCKAVNLVKSEGTILFYVYKKKFFLREWMDDSIRFFTTRMSMKNCLKFSRFMYRLGKVLHQIHPRLHLWIYWRVAKCFYNPKFTYENNLRINYDWYSPPIAHRHTLSEVYEWTHALHLEIQHLDEGRSGISVKAKNLA